MAAGPAMAGLMTSLDFRIPFLPGRPIVVNDVTAPGWIMTLWWALFLVGVFIFFKVGCDVTIVLSVDIVFIQGGYDVVLSLLITIAFLKAGDTSSQRC